METLGEDMLSYVSAGLEIPAEALEGALPESYRIYESCTPRYALLRDSYLGNLSHLMHPLFSVGYPVIKEGIREIASELPDEAFESDRGVSTLLEGCRDSLKAVYVNQLERQESELGAAFEESRRELGFVRTGYLNLERAGYSKDRLPEAEPADMESLADVLASFLLSELAEAETVLKNRPPESEDSPYAVFWVK